MSGILTPILMLAGLGAGIYLMMHRCDILGFCGDTAGAVGPPGPPGPAAVGVDEDGDAKATDVDNGKSQTCGCCKCTQKSTNSIHCVKDSGDVLDYTTGNSLSKQCKRCSEDPTSCKGASTTQTVNAPDSEVAKKASTAACGSKLCQDNPSLCASLKCPVRCGSGLKLNSNGVCVSATADKKQSNAKPNTGGDSPGCPAGKTLTNCKTQADGLHCSCSFARQVNYAKSYYADTGNYRVFRNRISFN